MIWRNQHGEEKHFTFHDLSRLSNQAANLLIKHGISKGDRVFLMLPRLPEWWIFSIALIKLGAIQCPSPTLLTPHDLEFRVKFGKFKMVITDTENAYKFDEIYDECPSLASRLLVDGERRTGSATGPKSPGRTRSFRAARSKARSRSIPSPICRCC